MRPIKFRGKNAKGENIFVEFERPLKFNGETVGNVAQLVGYDAKGNEVYEGDELVTPDGTTIYAAICSHAKIAPAKDVSFTEMAKSGDWTLKEAEKNDEVQ